MKKKLVAIEVKYADLELKDGSDITVIVDCLEMEKRCFGKIKEFKTKWAIPNWKENHDAIRASTSINPMTGNKEVDFNLYKTICLERFLKEWDATDEAGRAVPVCTESIMSLNFTIAKAIVDQFVNIQIPNEEELGRLTYSADRYYKGRIPQGEIPPDVCIELALWERFGWGPRDTDEMSLRRMRELFAVLEQQRVSKDAVEMGGPSDDRMTQKMSEKKIAEEQRQAMERIEKARNKGGKNGTTDKGK